LQLVEKFEALFFDSQSSLFFAPPFLPSNLDSNIYGIIFIFTE